MAVGKMFFQTGHAPMHDVFSYTKTKPLWIDHEWGSGVIFYAVNEWFGSYGLFVLKTLSLFLILFIISKIIQLQNKKEIDDLNFGFYFITFVGMIYGVMSIIRCQIFTFVLFALFIYLLEKIRRGENRLLWTIPAIMLVWTNLHGGFVSGLGLIFIYGIGEFLNKKPYAKYFLILIPAVLTTFINPWGYKYLQYIFEATTLNRTTIHEWSPVPLFGPFANWKGFKIFLIASIISLCWSLKNIQFKYSKIDKVKYLLIFITMYLGIKHMKHVPLCVIATSVFMYHDFYSIFRSIKNFISDKFGVAEKYFKYIGFAKDLALFGFIIFAGSLLIAFGINKPVINPLQFPVGSIEFIKTNHLKGNLLTLFHWGSFATWNLYPSCLIAEDGRYEEVYPEKLHMQVFNFNYKYNKNWLDITKEYKTDLLLVEKKNDSFLALLQSKEWSCVYNDFVSAVFVPTKKLKKKYIQPVVNSDIIYKDKYNTLIEF